MIVLLLPGLLLASALLLSASQTLAAVPPNPPPDPPQNPPAFVYRYAVKIVCATDSPDGSLDFAGGGSTLGRTEGVLADADLFQTAVNVFNAPDKRIQLTVDVILAHGPGEDPIRSLRSLVTIEQADAVEFDCDFFRSAVAGAVPGGTGFLFIESFNEVEVAAVYTVVEKSGCNGGVRTVIPGRARGTDCQGAGVSMDVEYIKPRVLPQ
jgi:hypothetical protein